jgi:ABC-2 type transport system permease protein
MNATYSMSTEIRRQWSRLRTRWALGFMILLPIIVLIAFQLGPDDDDGGGPGFISMATSGAANFTIFTVIVSQAFLLIVVAALFSGDAVASEASWGSLRYLLAIPVARGRLLAVKFVVSLLSTGVAIALLTGTSLVIGVIAYGWHPLQTPIGDDISASAALVRLAAMLGYLAVSLLVVSSLAFLLSVSTDAPLGAVGGAVLIVIVSSILDQISALGVLRDFLPTHFTDAWQGLFTDPVQLDDLVKGCVSAAIYASLFAAAAWVRFLRKDITS